METPVFIVIRRIAAKELDPWSRDIKHVTHSHMVV